MDFKNLDTWVNISQIVTALGILIAVWQLKADHDKGRREFSARLIWEWTHSIKRNSKITTKLIDQLGPTECQAIFNQTAFVLNPNNEDLLKAAISDTEYKLLTSSKGLEVDISISSHLRSMVTNYLNLLESIFVAWYHRVGDKKIIEEQFRYMINPEGEKIFLATYLEAAGGSKNYPMLCEYISYLKKKKFPKGGSRNAPA